jgi:hypothetical protein
MTGSNTGNRPGSTRAQIVTAFFAGVSAFGRVTEILWNVFNS